MSWSVTNVSGESFVLDDAWIPHGRFRGDGHVRLDVPVDAGQSTLLTLDVTSHEPFGTVVENAFLILRVRSGATRARIFARMRIEFGATGMTPAVETVSTMTSSR